MDLEQAQAHMRAVEEHLAAAEKIVAGHAAEIEKATRRSYEPWDNAKDQGRQVRSNLGLVGELLGAALKTVGKTRAKMHDAARAIDEQQAQRRAKSASAARI